MNERIFDCVPMLLINVQRKTVTRYVGKRSTNCWSVTWPVSKETLEDARLNPQRYVKKEEGATK